MRYPLLILTACLLGAIGAFSYSYAPLHRAKDWRIDYLEDRIEIRNIQVKELEEELAQARNSLEGQPSDEEMKALRAQLGEATKLAEARERETQDLDRKLASMTKSRDSYKRRHASAAADLKAKAAASKAAASKAASKTADVAESSPPSPTTPEPEAAVPPTDTPEAEPSMPAAPSPVPEDASDSRDSIED